MGQVITVQTGNGQDSVLVCAQIGLPDVAGGVITVTGHIQAPGLPRVPLVTPGALLAPPVPSNGATYWNLQANVLTGAVSQVIAAPGAVTTPGTAGPSLPLLLGQLMPAASAAAALGAADPSPAVTGPMLPLLLGTQLAAPGRSPYRGGRDPIGLVDNSNNVVLFRQTLTPASPAAPWANPSNATIDLY